VDIKDKNELKEVIEKIFDKNSASSIFDEVENLKTSFTFINDFNFQDRNSGELDKINDDIGRTHGFRLSFVKNIAPRKGEGDYFISVTYESDLYTNSDKPEAFQKDYRDVVYWSDEGFYKADVYYKEENVLKFVIGKMKSRDAYYYEAGIGYHEINADDADRGVIISSISQQSWFHHALNEGGPTIREYNYMDQTGVSQASIIATAEMGRDFTLIEKANSRTFTRVGVESVLSGIENASYVGTYIKFGHDYDPGKSSSLPAVRVVGGLRAKKFSDSTYSETFFELTAQGKHLGASLKYSLPLSDDPKYLNPLPNDFANRELVQPKKESLIWLTISGKL
jgi:hypothetical protein